MNKTPLFLTLFAALLWTPLAADETTDYGPPPTGKTVEIVRAFMDTQLKDAESARYEWPETVEPATLKAGALSGRKSIHGWRADVKVNAKNSLGGYTGWQHWAYLIRDDKVVAWNERADLNLNTWRVVK